jgi:hypothetical protein
MLNLDVRCRDDPRVLVVKFYEMRATTKWAPGGRSDPSSAVFRFYRCGGV